MTGMQQNLTLSLTPAQAVLPGVFSGNESAEEVVPLIVNYCRFSKCQQAQILFTSKSYKNFEELKESAGCFIVGINALAMGDEEFDCELSEGPQLEPGEDETFRFRYIRVIVTRLSKTK